MTVFTNPAARAAGAAAAYRDSILALVAGEDPLVLLPRLPGEIREVMAGLEPVRLQRPEAPGKWSIAGVLQHLADSEVVHGWRLRLVLGQDRPPLAGYDQDSWAARLHYDDVDVALALSVLEANRAAHLRLYQGLTPADWQRVGLHAERGEESVAVIARLYAGHDRVHLKQMRRIRAGQGG